MLRLLFEKRNWTNTHWWWHTSSRERILYSFWSAWPQWALIGKSMFHQWTVEWIRKCHHILSYRVAKRRLFNSGWTIPWSRHALITHKQTVKCGRSTQWLMHSRFTFTFTSWHVCSLICMLSTFPEWTNSRDLWEFDVPLLPTGRRGKKKNVWNF